jgi:multiple sugar transport system permease protein
VASEDITAGRGHRALDATSRRARPWIGVRGAGIDVLLVAMLLIFVVPIALMAVFAFMTDRAIISPSLDVEFTLQNLLAIFAPEQPLKIQLVNSLSIVAGTVVTCGAVSTLAAYSLAKLRVSRWLRYPVGAACAVLPLLPPMTLVPGFYVTLTQLGLLGSNWGLILLNTILNLPFSTLLMKIAFDEAPKSLREAALIDGASERQVLMKVMLPLVTPALATTSIFTAIMTWNEFLMALTMTSGGTTSPLSVGIASMVQPYDARWGQLSAAGSLAVLPIICLSIFASKKIVAGMTRGAVKG